MLLQKGSIFEKNDFDVKLKLDRCMFNNDEEIQLDQN